MRKRILFFIESFSGGGAERVLLTILRNIDKTKFNITVLVVSDEGVYKKDFYELGINIVPILNNKWSLLNNIKYKLIYNWLPPKVVVKWILKGLKADTYVAFVEGYCTKIFAMLPQDKHKIAWVHIDLDAFPWTIEKGIFRTRNKEIQAYQSYNRINGVSQQVSDVLTNKFGLNNVKTIYNPVDESRIKELSMVEKNDIDTSAFNIVSVGRLTRQKGYDKLIGLMPHMLKLNPKLRLYIIGEGEERKNLEAYIEKMNLGKFVKLLGYKENPYSIMKNMDLFVCSSIAEGFSLVIAEAMIAGLPIVSMECAGPNELLSKGEYGILCSSYTELSDIILKISKDYNLLKTLKEKSYERSLFFNTTDIVRQIESIL